MVIDTPTFIPLAPDDHRIVWRQRTNHTLLDRSQSMPALAVPIAASGHIQRFRGDLRLVRLPELHKRGCSCICATLMGATAGAV
jgi:hypothetical protein